MFISRVAVPLVKQLFCSSPIKKVAINLDSQHNTIKENLETSVTALSKIERHPKNMAGLNEAASKIHKIWKEDIKLKVETQIYNGPPEDPNEYKNLIVSFGPRNAPRIVLGAHYDSEPESKTPGADDNLSGIAGIIEISRLLKELNPNLKIGIDIVAYSTEERPHYALENKDHEKHIPYMGSYVHAKSLKDTNIDVIGAIILEMIGYYSSKNNSQNYPVNILKLFYPRKGDFIGVIGNLDSFELIQKIAIGIKQNSSIKVRSLSAPKALVPDISRSDHDSYNMHGYKGCMINNTAEFRNPNYHKLTDTPDTLDYEKMSEVVKGVFKTIVAMAT